MNLPLVKYFPCILLWYFVYIDFRLGIHVVGPYLQFDLCNEVMNDYEKVFKFTLDCADVNPDTGKVNPYVMASK